MVQELFYTSAPRGLDPGLSGFCTVAASERMSPRLVERLELLSGYHALFPATDPRAADNPVSHAHWRLDLAGRRYHILSRTCFSGFDHTGRGNKFAHHLALDEGELVPVGPAWLMRQSGVMETSWSGPPRLITGQRPLPRTNPPPQVARSWTSLTGDAGWAGELAATAEGHQPVYLIYPLGADVLALVDEALRLLPATRRWDVTFNTYFTELPAGLNCLWRCCVAGSPAAKSAGGKIVDLTSPMGTPASSVYVESARSGRPVPDASPRPTPPSDAPALLTPRTGAVPMEVEALPLAPRLATKADRRPPPVSEDPVKPSRKKTLWIIAATVVPVLVVLGILLLLMMSDGERTVAQQMPDVPATQPAAEEMVQAGVGTTLQVEQTAQAAGKTALAGAPAPASHPAERTAPMTGPPTPAVAGQADSPKQPDAGKLQPADPENQQVHVVIWEADSTTRPTAGDPEAQEAKDPADEKSKAPASLEDDQQSPMFMARSEQPSDSRNVASHSTIFRLDPDGKRTYFPVVTQQGWARVERFSVELPQEAEGWKVSWAPRNRMVQIKKGPLLLNIGYEEGEHGWQLWCEIPLKHQPNTPQAMNNEKLLDWLDGKKLIFRPVDVEGAKEFPVHLQTRTGAAGR